MQIASGTYRLGELRAIELVQAASVAVEVTVGSNVLLAETLFADADGWVRIFGFSELLKPYFSALYNAVTVKVGSSIYNLSVTYHLLTNGEDAERFDDVLDGEEAHEGIAPIRTFSFVNADGVTESIKVFGVETEIPEIETEYGVISGVEKLIDARYKVKHEIATARLSGREIKVLTGLLTSDYVTLGDDQIIIDVDAELVKWLNNPQEDRVAKFSWRYASLAKAYTEYDGVIDNISFHRRIESGTPLRLFAYMDKSGNIDPFILWGVESQKREYDSTIVMRNGMQSDADKYYRIAHVLTTDRMSRNELRALVLLATSSSVVLDSEAVVIKDLQVNISSDPQSDRTASFTWYYADTRRRVDE